MKLVIIRSSKSRKMKRAGQVRRLEEVRNAYSYVALAGEQGGKRSVRRYIDIRIGLKTEWKCFSLCDGFL
jgi:hypothetical protein